MSANPVLLYSLQLYAYSPIEGCTCQTLIDSVRMLKPYSTDVKHMDKVQQL
jgi:hypothetical protein